LKEHNPLVSWLKICAAASSLILLQASYSIHVVLVVLVVVVVVVVAAAAAAVVAVVVSCKIPSVQTRLQYRPAGYRTSPKLRTKIACFFRHTSN
jgi:hypothetical protein